MRAYTRIYRVYARIYANILRICTYIREYIAYMYVYTRIYRVAESPTKEELCAAMKPLLEGQNLDHVSLRQLRRGVVQRLDLQKWQGRALQGRRREVFQEAAQIVVDGIRSAAQLLTPANAAPARPEWFVLEDDDVASAVYNVTFAAVLYDTAQAALHTT